MRRAPPATSAPARRNRSQQRDRLLAWLRSNETHPTAAQIHAGLVLEKPNLSLGTVYRNLEMLVAAGEVDEVACTGGPARYDANIDPHHHFTCERCGGIVDVDVGVPRGLSRRLESSHGLRARRVRISFFGLCSECEGGSEEEVAGASAD